MRTIFMAIACMYVSISCYAQISDAEADAVANLLGVQKKQAIAKLVSVSGKDSIAFWKLYNEYQEKNLAIAKNRIRLYEQTAHSYGNMTPASADSLAKKYFENRMVQEKSLEEYYKKIKAATNSVVAFQFYQAEIYLTTQIRASIMQQIPTYGEIQLAAKKKQ
ncbi:hypothetical protein OCK74_03690 [Chitinophagaceae bacterium LB-8]|uniref:DUF4142 domain-containing protein n=1 Tax=Paraflavisolibacter caeni TaxID=2982496 RepID=A0A9X3BGX9_9BACT|nr:hypothetical protein [Paraflavisolibacter caeni]MCU7548198.1 hypothetical protein [Paraflavisolibacter caeni]